MKKQYVLVSYSFCNLPGERLGFHSGESEYEGENDQGSFKERSHVKDVLYTMIRQLGSFRFGGR